MSRLSYTEAQIDEGIGRALTELAEKPASSTAGDLASLDASGNLDDSGIAVSSVALKSEVQNVQDEIDNITPKRTASNDPSSSSFSVLCDTAIAGQAKPRLYGKSVVINQLLQNGNFADASGWSGSNGTVAVSSNALTYTATSASSWYNNRVNSPSVTLVQGHRYYVAAYCKAASATQFYLSSYSVSAASSPFADTSLGTLTANTSTATGAIVDAAVSCQDGELRFSLRNGMAVNDTFELRNVVCIDLTAIGFTSAETASVSALKVAWLKKFGYPLPLYIPYNQGSIVSNNATYQLHGRNIWDEEWRNGYYDGNTGAFVANSSFVANQNAIRVSPSTAYYCNIAAVWQALYYDANGNFLSHSASMSAPAAVTTPDNCAYMNFYVGGTYGGTYKNDICFNLSDASFNGQYEASFNGGSVTADNLNGIGTAMDSQDAEGQIVRKFPLIDLGTITYTRSVASGVYYFEGDVPNVANGEANILCARYTLDNVAVFNMADKTCRTVTNKIYIRDDSYTDAATFKAAMSGVMFGYKTTVPTTETTTPSDISTQAGYNSLDPVSGDVQSAECECEYPVDIVAYVDSKVADLTALMSSI